MYKNATQTYRDNSVLTNSPAKRVSLAMDICITALNDAADAADKDDIQRRAAANGKARQIIIHLQSMLNMEQGGEIAQNLHQIYSFAQRRLSDVDFKNDGAAAREVAELLAPLRQAWQELHDTNEANSVSPNNRTDSKREEGRAKAVSLST